MLPKIPACGPDWLHEVKFDGCAATAGSARQHAPRVRLDRAFPYPAKQSVAMMRASRFSRYYGSAVRSPGLPNSMDKLAMHQIAFSALVLALGLIGSAPAHAGPIAARDTRELATETADPSTPGYAPMTRLCSQYLDLAGRAAEWTKRYGEDHLATLNLRKQMQNVCNSIQEELSRNNVPSGERARLCEATSICSQTPIK
jgi:hypothetical protein